MKKQKVFNILDLVRSRYVQVVKMMPFYPDLGKRLNLTMKLLRRVCFGKIVGLGYRAKLSMNFINFVLNLYREHGGTFTVKWMKASYVAIQKELGKDRVRTLRVLEPDLPLPRLTNGLPRIIPVYDRRLIRKGDVGVIRF